MRVTMGMSSLVIAACAGLFSTARLEAQKIDPNEYYTIWSHVHGALEKAKKNRCGILYYFAPKGATELPPLFRQRPMSELSRQVPVVRVDGKTPGAKTLRKRFEVEEKYPTYVMTDYYGNLIQRFVAKRGVRMKIDVNRVFRSRIDYGPTKKWIDGLKKKIAKSMARADKSYARKRYRKAIPDYLWVAALKGFPERTHAEERLADIETSGKRQLEAAAKLLDDEAKKLLRKIAKEYDGTAVAQQARARLDEIAKRQAGGGGGGV